MKASELRERTTHRKWVTAALLIAMFMTAIEITIVATAMPRIVSDLGGFAQLSWVFSSYLLTQVVCIPIYGKLADLYGRKPVFLTGIILFLIASILCGLSQTMTQLIAFRFLQGIGGGAVQPIAVTIIGDLYKPEERHRVQGWAGSVFAFSSIVGPTLGAFIVEQGHWSWIFYLNVPIGILAFAIIWFFLHEKKEKHQHKIDFVGAGLLVGAISALMSALLQGGSTWPWLSWQLGSCIVGFIVLMTCLLIWEKRVPEPVLPLWLFKHPLIKLAGIVTFLNGAVLIGYSAMIPTYVQGVLGKSALVAGMVLGGMSIGWPIASFYSGKLMMKIGFRSTALIGATTLLIASIAIATVAKTSIAGLCIFVFIGGMGLGFQSTAFMVTIQSSVSWKERGVATANNIFMRTLGSAVGAAAFGGILNATISRVLEKNSVEVPSGARNSLELVNHLLDGSLTGMSPQSLPTVIEALRSGMSAVFYAAIVASFVGVVFALYLPKKYEYQVDSKKPL